MLKFLARYEPKVKIKEREDTFKNFPETNIQNLLKIPLKGKIDKLNSTKRVLSSKLFFPKKIPYQFYSQNKPKLDSAKALIHTLDRVIHNIRPFSISTTKLRERVIPKTNTPSFECSFEPIKKSPIIKYMEVKKENIMSYELRPPLKLFLSKSLSRENVNIKNIAVCKNSVKKRRLFVLKKQLREFIMKPKPSEISDEEIQKWKNLYLTFNESRKLDMRQYLDFLRKNPKMKKILDLYLAHKRIVPAADCNFANKNSKYYN